MLALGRALMSRPNLLLLDEPSMGLAPRLVEQVFAEILKMKDAGVTVLLVEQNAVATLQIADRAYVMETGEILLEGKAADLLHNPEVKRAYLGKAGAELWKGETRNLKELAHGRQGQEQPGSGSANTRAAATAQSRPRSVVTFP